MSLAHRLSSSAMPRYSGTTNFRFAPCELAKAHRRCPLSGPPTLSILNHMKIIKIKVHFKAYIAVFNPKNIVIE
jgi:hypothetical protein